MKRIFMFVSITWIVFALLGTAWAADQSQQNEQAQPRPMMKCQERFDALDTNHDGVVTMDEFMAVKHPGGRAQEIFTSRDINGDGKLTKEEFCSGKGKGRGKGRGNVP
jgi:hypothetical protein